MDSTTIYNNNDNDQNAAFTLDQQSFVLSLCFLSFVYNNKYIPDWFVIVYNRVQRLHSSHLLDLYYYYVVDFVQYGFVYVIDIKLNSSNKSYIHIHLITFTLIINVLPIYKRLQINNKLYGNYIIYILLYILYNILKIDIFIHNKEKKKCYKKYMN